MTTAICISINQHFNWKECLWYLDRGYDDCIYKVYPDNVRRAFDMNGVRMLVEISHRNNALYIRWLVGEPAQADIHYIERFVSEWFDIDTDLDPFYELLQSNPTLAYMPENYSGLRFIGMPDLFESLAWCIIGQQINLTFAYKIKRRLVENYGDFVEYENERYWIFPAPEKVSSLSVTELRDLQFSNKKAEYLVGVADALVRNILSREILSGLPDLVSRQKMLTAIRGIGIWTANYVLMKSLKEPCCIPFGDAGLLNALMNHEVIKVKTDRPSIDDFFETFSGWESYLTFYLWRTLSESGQN
jgi:DNA-3-methyladenine glycosylase II